jgi:hypothetical protein
MVMVMPVHETVVSISKSKMLLCFSLLAAFMAGVPIDVMSARHVHEVDAEPIENAAREKTTERAHATEQYDLRSPWGHYRCNPLPLHLLKNAMQYHSNALPKSQRHCGDGEDDE